MEISDVELKKSLIDIKLDLNSEKYLTHHKTPSHILYLKTNNIKTIVETFGLYHITVEQNSTITYENMKFLWYKYLKSKQYNFFLYLIFKILEYH